MQSCSRHIGITPSRSRPDLDPDLAPDPAPIPQGFSDWKRADFNAFVRGCELFGRNDLASVTSEVEGKTEKEVAKYASTFFTRYKEIKDWEKVLVTCLFMILRVIFSFSFSSLSSSMHYGCS